MLTFGSNSGPPIHKLFDPGYAVMEKVQMTIFTAQELLISIVYIRASRNFMQYTVSDTRRKLLRYLLVVNVIIIAIDLVLLGTEYANLYVIYAIFKSLVYSVKLKLEFSVLGRLIDLTRPAGGGGGGGGMACDTTTRATLAHSEGTPASPTSLGPFEVHKMAAFGRTSRADSEEISQSPRSWMRERAF